MKRFMLNSFFILCSVALIPHTSYAVPPYISFRSQGVSNARHLVGVSQDVNKPNMTFPYGLLSATFEYGKIFNGNALTRTLFAGALQCDKLVISGSAVPNRGAKDWFADYFYLPPDFQSTVSFAPSISHFLVDFSWYLGLDQWHEGLYFALYAPFVHTKSKMGICENVLAKSSANFAAGYFGPQPVSVGALESGFASYANGDPIADIQQTLAGTSIPAISVALQSLNYARISSESKKKTRLADLRAIFGWNIINEDNGSRVGMYAAVAAPTGIRPKGKYLLEPMVGNGHLWELGFGVNGAYALYDNPERDYKLTFQGDFTLSHLFGTRQKRTFDLKGKPFSRYMLALKFKDTVANNLEAGGATPSAQFDNEMAPVANLSTIRVRASAAAQADIVAMLTFTMPHWSFDCGYNFWIRAAERLHLDEVSTTEAAMQHWGLKGDARVFGFIPNGGGATLLANTAIALSATEHDATINTGLNGTNTLNANVDAAALATADTNNVRLQNQTGSANTVTNQINTSPIPHFFTPADFEICSVSTLGLSSSIFGNIQYHWHQDGEWQPSLGFGFNVEFAHTSNPRSTEHDHPACTASTWNTWIKAAVAFN